MKIKDILKDLESWAPPAYQESYDNSGLLVGDKNNDLTGAMISLDVTMEVIDEAIAKKCNLIVAHHPLIFRGIKKLVPGHWVNDCLLKAIKNDIAIYAIHTNLDNISGGVNWQIGNKIGLENLSILSPKADSLQKLVTFIPKDYTQKVLDAVHKAGAGRIGNYDNSSFSHDGTGTFRPNENANPAIGERGKVERVEETRIEVLVPIQKSGQIISALEEAHPYEVVAHYLQPLNNLNQDVGSGAIGELPSKMDFQSFIALLKSSMSLEVIKCTKPVKSELKSVAVCGGSGSFLLPAAKRAKADVFITSDFKYHEFFEAEDQITIMDIGHYESEVFTKDLIADRLRENFANIALHLSQVVTNPIKYL